MKIRTKALLIYAFAFAVFFLAISVGGGSFVVEDFMALEREQAKLDARRALAALAAAQSRLRAACRDNARWDEARAYVLAPDPAFPKLNYPDSVLAAQQLNFLVIADAVGETLFAVYHDPDAGAVEFPREIVDSLREQRLLNLSGDLADSSRSGVLLLRDGAALVAAEPILTTDSQGPAVGTMVMGRVFDQRLIDVLRETSMLDVRAESPAALASMNRLEDAALLKKGEAVAEDAHGDRLAARILVRDVKGAPALILTVNREKNLLRAGTRITETFAAMSLGGAFLLLVLSGWLLERFILRRVTDASGRVRAMSREGDFSRRLPADGADEITALSDEINALLDSLGKAEAETKRQARDLLQARDAAQDASRVKSEFLAKMSHEIRTPINTIVGMTDIARRAERDPGQREYLEMIAESTHQLQAVVEEILDFSKIEAGRVELINEDFDLRRTVASVIRGLEPEARKKNLALKTVIAPNAPRMVRGDPTRLRQILTNLTANAVKFTEVGEVRLTVERLESESRPDKIGVFFEVADTGIGIAADKLEVVFESFVQTDGAATRKYGGAGLGLSICKQLAGLMGCEIDVRSVLGQGSVFSFSVFFDQPRPGETGDEAVPARELPEGRTFNILLVEDNPANRKIVELYLKDAPYAIETAENGEEALEKFTTGDYDLVLMDMEMPVMDGYEATQRIRDWENELDLPPAPILALTAHAWTAQRERCLAAGCTDFISKPVGRDKLLRIIVSHLAASADVPAGETLFEKRENGDRWKAAPAASGTGPDMEADSGPAANGGPNRPAPSLAEPEETPDFSPETFKIRPDPELRGLIPAFLHSVERDAGDMRRAFASEEYETVVRIGHSLKGAAPSYGFDRIGYLGAEIERAAERRDGSRLGALLATLDAYLKKVEIMN